MTEKMFEGFCQTGEKADALYSEGRYSEAHDAYVLLLRDIETKGAIDSYLIAKITLGLLLTHIRSGRFQQAFAIWNASIEESLFGIGIYSLEHAQTSIQDMVLYDFACACLHSLSEGDKEASAEAVNLYMSRICEQMREHGDHDNLRLAVCNWKTHLREIFGTSIPHRLAQPLIEAERSLPGGPVRPQSLSFPTPSPWTKPDGFREMSRLIPFEPLEFRRSRTAENGSAARKIHKK